MDDNYFDKRMKDILESAPEMEPSPAAMQQMQDLLRAANSPNWSQWALWGMLLLLIPLFWGGTVLYRQNLQLQSDMYNLSAQLTEQRTETQTKEQYTTLYLDTIYRIDTIIKTVYVEEYRYEESRYNTPSSNRLLGSTRPINSSVSSQVIPGQSLLGWTQGSNPFLSPAADSPASSSTDPVTAEMDKTWDAWSALEPIPGRVIPNPSLIHSSLAFLLDASYLDDQKKHRINPLHYFTPTGLDASTHFTPFLMNDDNPTGSRMQLGLMANVQLPQSRSISLGAEWVRGRFELKDPEDTGSYPVVGTDSPTDILHELKGDLKYLQLPVMLRQGFGKNEKWKPFLSAGVVAVKPLQQRFVYEYLNGGGDYKRRANLNTGQLAIQHARFGLGVDYIWKEKWLFRPEFIYQHEWSTPIPAYWSMQYWTLRFGIGYQW